jgi:hypothetical protein
MCVTEQKCGAMMPIHCSMKRFLLAILVLTVGSAAFAIAPKSASSSHARSGYDFEDIAVSVAVNSGEEGRMWLVAKNSYPLLFSERDMLLRLVRVAAGKIEIAIANKTTISYVQEVGSFYTDDAARVVDSFETDGYASSYAKVQIMGKGKSVILMLDKQDTQDFIGVVGGIVDDLTRQKELFN